MAGGAVRTELVNAELLTLTYGAMVSQLIRDYEDPLEVNVQLEAMGYNIGVRVVDEFCAKSKGVRCRNFRETMDTVAREAFKMFLGVSAVLTEVAADGSSCVLRIPDNPLADFVELPAAYSTLRYSNILCGVIRGALEMVSLRVTCAFVKDVLAGDDGTEIRVTLQEVLGEGAGAAYRDD